MLVLSSGSSLGKRKRHYVRGWMNPTKRKQIPKAMKKVVLKWDRMTVLQKINKVRFVVTKMTLNATTFLAPNPPMPILEGLADALATAESNATLGGTDRTETRDIALQNMENAMGLEVLYVQTVTLGDEVMTGKAGMEVQSVATRWSEPDMPQGFIVKPGSLEGSIYMRCGRTLYKKEYVFEMWVESNVVPPPTPPIPPTPPTVPIPSNSSSAVVSGSWIPIHTQSSGRYQHVGLVRGKIYRFRVYAQNAKGRSIASSEASCAAR